MNDADHDPLSVTVLDLSALSRMTQYTCEELQRLGLDNAADLANELCKRVNDCLVAAQASTHRARTVEAKKTIAS